ncbi:MAG: hypothetical protein ACYC5K_01575 [Saccharofermentanales bacterium]
MKIPKSIAPFLLCAILAALMLSACTAFSAPTSAPSGATVSSLAASIASPSPTTPPSATSAPDATPTEGPYHVGGPDLIRLYLKRHLVVDEFRSTWETGKDIGVFYAYPTQKESVENLPYMDLFKKYWNTDIFPQADEYKIGYHLSFTLQSKEVVEMTIRLPKDCPKDPKAYFYQYIEIYVYDNLHRIPGPTFYHLEESSTYAETIMTSIKLTAGTKSDQVESARLTVFVFKDDCDFDPVTGDYIGKTSYTVDVLRN